MCRSARRGHRGRRTKRKGSTIVETAFVLPVFFVFAFGLMQIGHINMVHRVMERACLAAARLGATDGISTEEVESHLRGVLSTAFDQSYATVLVKDASVFDDGGDLPATSDDFSNLSDIELEDADTGDLFVVRATLRYNDIALIPLSVMDDIELTSHSLARHE